MRNAIAIVSGVVLIASLLVGCETGAVANNESSRLSFAISFPEELSPEALDGRVLLVIFESKLLTEFWGWPTELGAHILLPEGFDEHPEARYPLAIFHGHFPADFGGFRENASRSISGAGVQCAVRHRRVQHRCSGARLRVLSAMDGT